jgi:hypothetical protein
VLGLFGMTLAATGASEKTLKRVGKPYKKVRGVPGFLQSLVEPTSVRGRPTFSPQRRIPTHRFCPVRCHTSSHNGQFVCV